MLLTNTADCYRTNKVFLNLNIESDEANNMRTWNTDETFIKENNKLKPWR